MNKKWIEAAGVRAVKTLSQTAIATIGTAAALGEINWALVASAYALAADGYTIGDDGWAVKTETTTA